jgi:hypothetical protein
MSTPTNYYSNIAARYLQQRKPKPEPQLPPKERIPPPSPAYASVAPRYLSPRREPEPQPLNVPDLLFRKADHEALGGKIYRSVQPRYMDPSLYRDNDFSPRKIIEHRLHENHRSLKWRSDTLAPLSMTFDDHMKYTKAREARAPSPKRVYKGQSPIRDYIKNGVPIRGMPGSEHNQTHDNTSRPQSRASSPSRSGSPVGPRWCHAGSHPSTFEERYKTTLLSQRKFKMEEDRVKQNIEERMHAKVPRDAIPRVATMSDGYRLQEYLSQERERQSPRRREDSHLEQEPLASNSSPLSYSIVHEPS